MVRQYEDFERQQMEILKQHKKEETDCIFCPKCRSRWFEEVELYQFRANHNVILGQQVPVKPGSIPYYVLKCVRCGDLLEPRIIHNTRDIGGNDYDSLLDTLEGKDDAREKEEDQVAYLQNIINGLQERIELLEQNKNTKTTNANKKPVKGKKKLEVPVEKL